MGKVERQEVIQNIIEKLRLSTAVDNVPLDVAKEIVATIDAEPLPQIQIAEASISDATGGTILTASTTKRTFVTGLNLSVAKDVVSTSLFSSIRVIHKGGAVQETLIIRYEPVTANEFTRTIVFDKPIRLEEGSIVTVANSTAIASIDTTAVVYFYEEEP